MKVNATEYEMPDSCKVMAGNDHRGYCGYCGFTFPEIMMVIVIIGILAATALPYIFAGGMTALRAADVIVSDINFTRVEAIRKNIPLTLSSTSSFSYNYGNGHSRDLRKLGESLSFDQAVNVTFNSLGEPVGITEPLTISVTDSVDTVSITVAPYTGRVTLP